MSIIIIIIIIHTLAKEYAEPWEPRGLFEWFDYKSVNFLWQL